MASIGVQISAAVEAQIKVASVTLPGGTFTPPAGLTVERERLAAVLPEDVAGGPLVAISIGAERQVSRRHHADPKTDRVMELLVGIYAEATTLKGAEATDPAYLWVVRALQANPRLGGLSNFVSEEGYEASYTRAMDSTDTVAARELKIHYHFHTRTDDPAVRAN